MVQKAKKYAMEVSIKMVLMETDPRPPAAADQVPSEAAGNLYDESLHVGCINYDVREDSIKQALLPSGPFAPSP